MTPAAPKATPATSTTPQNEELRELLKRVRQVELKAKKKASASTAGAWHSRFKGRGMAFSESRAFADGDDPRHVDWRATARAGDMFVKQFVEERELTLLLVVDVSGSMTTGSRGRLRRQLAAEAAALLALSASKNQDKVGLVAFGSKVERLVRPQKGRGHVLRVIRDVLSLAPPATSTALPLALETAGHLVRQRAIVVVVSDCVGVTVPVKQLRALAARHDVAVVEVRDPLDRALPDVGLLSVRDAESGKQTLVDTSDARVRAAWRARFEALRGAREADLKKAGVDHVVVEIGGAPGTNDDDSLLPLLRFLRQRSRRVA
jgi:uncharacterized protein (DUF58 family)